MPTYLQRVNKTKSHHLHLVFKLQLQKKSWSILLKKEFLFSDIITLIGSYAIRSQYVEVLSS